MWPWLVIIALLLVVLVAQFMERRELSAELEAIYRELREIHRLLFRLVVSGEPTGFTITQVTRTQVTQVTKIGDSTMPTDLSIVAGTSGVFVAAPQPPGSAPDPSQPVPAWVASDPAVEIKASADGLTASVAVPATDTGTGFTLGISYTRKDGAVATGSVSVTITQPTPPPTPEPTSFTISQTS